MALNITTSPRAHSGTAEHAYCRDRCVEGAPVCGAPASRLSRCEDPSQVNPYKSNKVIKILGTSLPAAQVQVLSAALRAAQLDSVNEPEHQPMEGRHEGSVSDPSPASDNQTALSASSSQKELSEPRILQSTVRVCPLPLPRRCDRNHKAAFSFINISWQR